MERVGSEAAARGWSVLVIDDHELLASSLRAAFAQDGRAHVVGTAGSIEQGVHAAAALAPDIILTDRRLPDGDVDDHLPRLQAASPSSRILMMTGWPTQRSSMAALDGGVQGIISKAQPVSLILDAMERIRFGELVVPAELTAALLRRGGRSANVRRDELSRRELDVLEALACGASTVEVADRLCISSNTVRNHLARAMLKLDTHDRLSAVSEAIRLGLVAPRLPGSAPARSTAVAACS